MKTELSAWAERILFGVELADKLADPGQLVDAEPTPARARPAAPGRPPGLQMHRRPSRRPPPGRGAMADPAARAELLHHFANHELLALELMALALLRFPDADPRFRRTLAATMRDEQRHLALYLRRIAELGSEIGAAPVSAFFWDCLADAPDPAAFVAGMSLVLEQANLDFSRAWRQAVVDVGDDETAAILDEVYEDEIRHVRHGVRWLQAWSPDGVDLWTLWTSKLQFPLTPRRARGPVFDGAGRERAGLPASFIQRVKAAGHSKGRPPRVLWFCPWVEDDHARPGHTPGQAVREIAADLAPTLAFLAGEDDVVVVPRPPSAAFLGRLADAGAPLPRFVVAPRPHPALAQGRPISRVEPWGWSESVHRQVGPLAELAQDTRPWTPGTAHLARKDVAARALHDVLASLDDPRLDPPDTAGRVCADPEQARSAAAGRSVVVKAPWSSSGRGRIRPRGALTDPERGWLRRTLELQGAVVVEPWLDRVVDLSLHATVTDDGVRIDGLVRFVVDERGAFRGALLGRHTADLPTDVRRFLNADGADPQWVRATLETALHRALADAPDHRGPVSIDAFVHRTPDGLRLRPLVEVNPRHTFGRVALGVQRRLLAPGVSGVWWHVDRRQLADLGWASFADLEGALGERRPPRGVPLRKGALPTTEASAATAVWTVLTAGSDAHLPHGPARKAPTAEATN